MKTFTKEYIEYLYKEFGECKVLVNGQYLDITDYIGSDDEGIGYKPSGKEVTFKYHNVEAVVVGNSQYTLDMLNNEPTDNGEVNPGYEKPEEDSESKTSQFGEVINPSSPFFGVRGLVIEVDHKTSEVVLCNPLENSYICCELHEIAFFD